MEELRNNRFELTHFWNNQRILALDKLCCDEDLDRIKLAALIEASHINKKDPFSADLIGCLNNRPSIFKAKEISERIRARMVGFD